VAFVALYVPPLIDNPAADRLQPIAPVIDPVLAWVSVPALNVNVPDDEISAPVPPVTVPLLEFSLDDELLRVIAPITEIEAPVPAEEIVPVLLLVLDRVDPPVMFIALISCISAPVPPVTAPLFALESVPPLCTVLDEATVIKDPVPEAGPLLLLVNEPGPTDKVLPMDISLPTQFDETDPEFDCSAEPPVMPKLPVMPV
jgi:hypothetical protein